MDGNVERIDSSPPYEHAKVSCSPLCYSSSAQYATFYP
jgi:hypothetical protein